jgi:hypothetical protein
MWSSRGGPADGLASMTAGAMPGYVSPTAYNNMRAPTQQRSSFFRRFEGRDPCRQRGNSDALLVDGRPQPQAGRAPRDPDHFCVVIRCKSMSTSRYGRPSLRGSTPLSWRGWRSGARGLRQTRWRRVAIIVVVPSSRSRSMDRRRT